MSRRKSAFPFTTQRAGPYAVWPALYWDGRDNAGNPVPSGAYTAALETVISGNRQKATVDLTVQ